MTRRPSKKKAPAPRTGEYYVQLGAARHRDYIHRYNSEKEARAFARKIVDGFVADFQRYNPDGVATLDLLKEDVDSVVFEPTPTVINREVDAHNGYRIYLVFWKAT